MEPGARRVPRPPKVALCSGCGQPLVSGYGECPVCTEALDRYWQADWDALLAAEGITPGGEDERLLAQVVYAECESHPWTVVGHAMTFLRCGTCGAELGGGPADCTECHIGFGQALASEWAGNHLGLVTFNEHALHIGRWILRYPHRYSDNTLKGWRMSMPVVLTGVELPEPKTVQTMQQLIFEGRHEDAARMWEDELRRKGKPSFR